MAIVSIRKVMRALSDVRKRTGLSARICSIQTRADSASAPIFAKMKRVPGGAAWINVSMVGSGNQARTWTGPAAPARCLSIGSVNSTCSRC